MKVRNLGGGEWLITTASVQGYNGVWYLNVRTISTGLIHSLWTHIKIVRMLRRAGRGKR